MAEQRFYSDSLTRSGFSSQTIDEAEPVIKGESPSRPTVQTNRVVSAPSSLEIPSSTGKKGSKWHGEAEKPPEAESYPVYKRLCDDIFKELMRLDGFVVENEVRDEGTEVVAEIELLLELLYACPHGQGESLKRVVVAIQTQVNNARWDMRHIGFLKDVFRYLRARYLVNDESVNACYDAIKSHGLDEFRGTISVPRVLKRYRIEEVKENDKSNGAEP